MALTSCVSVKSSELRAAKPQLDPATFFTGRTFSSGVIESRIGSSRRVTTRTFGKWEGETLRLEQDLAFSDGVTQHRSWRIRRLNAHHYEATANDMVGTASGEADGNTFHWSFTLALSPGNPLANVRLTQWMYLQPDGRTLINHTTIRKFGIALAHVTEKFRRETVAKH